MVPDGWRVKKFSDVAVLKSGGTPSKDNPDYWAGDLPWISAASMHDIFVYDSDLRITEEGLAKGSRRAKKDSILLLVRGSMLWKHIPVCLTKRDVAFNQDVKNIVTNNKVTTSFLFYNLKSQENRLLHLVVGTGIGAGKLDTDDLSSLNIYTPPLPEQKKIAAILSTWDDSIAANEDLLANSRLRKKALMQQLLTGKKRLPGFGGKWSSCVLGKLFSRITERNCGQSTNVVTMSGRLGLINQEDYFSKSIASDTLDHYFIIKKGQFAYNKSYSNGYPVGAIKRLNRYDDGVVTTLYICFEISDEDISSGDFFEHYFESGLLNNRLGQIVQEGARAHGLLNVKPDDFFKLPITVPEYDEQVAIACVLTTADEEIEALEHRLNNLKLQKKALMQQLLTGKKRVKVEPVTA